MDVTSYLLGKKAGGGGDTPTGEIDITTNGVVNVTSYATANVNVQPILESKSVSITTNGTTTVNPTVGKDGLSSVEISTNVQPNLESKSVTITENTTTTITPTTGKDGLNSVTVTTNVSGDASEYFEEEPENISNVSSWVTLNYVKKAGTLKIPNSVTNLGSLFQSWRYPVAPKVICGNNVTLMGNMYGNSNKKSCDKVKIIDVSGLDTSNVTGMSYMFAYCEQLETLNLSNFDFSKIEGFSNPASVLGMFDGCTVLTNLTFGTGLGQGYTATTHRSSATLDLSTCTNLTHDSLMSVINNLYDLAGNNKNRQYLTIGATNMAKLSEAEIAIATAKGWDVQ